MSQGSKRILNESGQGIIEYLLVLFVAIFTASVLAKFSKSAWDRSVLGLGGRMEQSLKTGRTPSSAWKN